MYCWQPCELEPWPVNHATLPKNGQPLQDFGRQVTATNETVSLQTMALIIFERYFLTYSDYDKPGLLGRRTGREYKILKPRQRRSRE